MSTEQRPDWVIQTINKFIGKKDVVDALPPVGRNVQPEMVRLQAVIDTVRKHNIPEGEVIRLRGKARELLSLLDSKS